MVKVAARLFGEQSSVKSLSDLKKIKKNERSTLQKDVQKQNRHSSKSSPLPVILIL